ncbi:hypothetical protein [Qipengyuania flava]|uniref:hypothetical protein n=1 Tax=Qipengyuania flava TaxID=192812 RepID=UPI001C6288AC|nr:hypothetical protein [Qipengyuania flava]QYJ08413.1 hypothetical protein KUV82_06905 [Qipengyuania flava]
MKYMTGLALAVFFALPAQAHDTTLDILSVPSEADFAAAQSIADERIRQIEAGKHEDAISDTVAASELLAAKTSEKNLLIGQARTSVELYGPVERCVLATREHFSALRITLNYVCQHEQLLLLWTLRVDNLPQGWTITNLKFTDSY